MSEDTQHTAYTSMSLSPVLPISCCEVGLTIDLSFLLPLPLLDHGCERVPSNAGPSVRMKAQASQLVSWLGANRNFCLPMVMDILRKKNGIFGVRSL